MAGIRWTNPSVRALAGKDDPEQRVMDVARAVVLDAQDEGWGGPPFDSFALARLLGFDLVAKDELDDARLVSTGKQKVIEFNPNRPRARVRFSVAHEIAHSFFPDHAETDRYRSHRKEERRNDDWQLELLCNLAASELLMPVGSLATDADRILDINHLMDVRREYQVSTEALLLRVVRLTERKVGCFAAARIERPRGDVRFRLDYVVSSAGTSVPMKRGDLLPSDIPLRECTAVGYTAAGELELSGQMVRLECVGLPPYPGDKYPRIAGLVLLEAVEDEQQQLMTVVRGDVAEPRLGDSPEAIIVHVVNNKARRWGGRGVARHLAEVYPDAAREYAEWASTKGNLRLGAVHLSRASDVAVIASLVAQSGYGDSQKPRIRYVALSQALNELGEVGEKHKASVHMPQIGTGQAGGRWGIVRDLVRENLCMREVPVTVYIPKDAPMPNPDEQAALTLV